MKKLLNFVYDTWYGAAAVLFGVYALQGCHNFLLAHFKYAMPEWSGHLELGLAALVIVCMLNCLVAVIVSCIRRKWGRAFGQIGAGALMFVISLVASLLILIHGMFGPSEDHFNDGLTIPVGLECAEPEDESEIDATLPKPKRYVPDVKPDFKLINGSQGGIYGYLATVDPGEDGEVYLRAFEVTKGTPLSPRRIKQCTVEKVPGGNSQVIGSGKEFTIYEGDWDRYYAARIEIWFVPASGGRERKLKEKVFKVQGWMR